LLLDVFLRRRSEPPAGVSALLPETSSLRYLFMCSPVYYFPPIALIALSKLSCSILLMDGKGRFGRQASRFSVVPSTFLSFQVFSVGVTIAGCTAVSVHDRG